MIEFKLLKIQSFKSIFKAALDFESMKGQFFSLEGQNNTESFTSSNGSGKTTCLSALAFALYGTTLDIYMKAEEYQNKNTNIPLNLQLVFDVVNNTERDTYVVIRTLKNVKLYHNEEDISELTKTATEKKLLEILGITKEEFFSFTYLTQYAGGNFLNKTASEKLAVIKDFVFGEELLNIKTKIDSLLKESNTEYNNINAEVNKLEGSLSSLQDVLSHDSVECTITKQNVEDNKKRIEELKQVYNTINEKRREQSSLVTSYNRLKSDMSGLKLELEKAKQNICPTCGQHLVGDKVEQNIRTKAADIKNKAAEIKQSLQQIEQQLTHYGDKSTIEDEIYRLADVNKEYETANKYAEKQQYAKDNIEKIKAKLETLRKDYDLLEVKITQIKDLQKYFNTFFVQQVQQSFLSEIENYLNLYCYDVFNAEFSLKFTGNNLELLIGGKPYSYYSGGERQRIDFLFVFAIKVILSSFTDKCTNLLLCDESLSAQDGESYNNCIELIKQLSEACGLTTVLVSHRNTSNLQNKIIISRYADKTEVEISKQ